MAIVWLCLRAGDCGRRALTYVFKVGYGADSLGFSLGFLVIGKWPGNSAALRFITLLAVVLLFAYLQLVGSWISSTTFSEAHCSTFNWTGIMFSGLTVGIFEGLN